MPFKTFHSLNCSKAQVLLLAFATSVAVIATGCGMGTTVAPVAKDTSLAGVNGLVHGGPNAITNATVNLYATATAAYGTSSVLLGTTNTDSNGHFDFGSTALPCPATQQAYLTIVGGQTGGNTNNSQSLLMAALGPCTNISTSTVIYVSEVTTVAAGYALSNFIGISGTTVNVSAPATNNAITPSCTGTGSAMTCSAAGLAHAFLNALNLANSVSTSGTPLPTGQAYTTVPGNTNSVVPTLLLNTLGNILQSCVNSAGGTAGDSTSCGKLFTYTTPPTTSTASPVTPTNTLQAVVNLAKYPSLTPANVTALYGIATAQTFFSPALAAVPADYSIGVVYHGPTALVNYVYAFYSTTDISDNIYTLSQPTSSAGPVVLNQIASNGSSGASSGTITNLACAAASPCAGATDTLGNLWVANTNGTNLNVYDITTSTGAFTSYALPTGTNPNSAAVDRNNTVFVTSANATASNVYSKTTAASSFTALSVAGSPVTETPASPEYIAVDASGSLWNVNYNTTATNVTYIQNAGTVSAPAFTNAYVPVVVGSAGSGYTVMLDASGNAWVNNLSSLGKVTPGSTTATSTAISATGGNASATNPKVTANARFSTLDGDGNIFLPENNGATSVLFQYFPGTGNFIYLSPCTGNTGTACLASGLKIASPRNAITDSTGSVWVTNPSATVANGNLVQVIGTGAPTWPQLSYGLPGVRP
ncbi:MAG TPA: hypothetical protein VGB94_09915 [Acidobacteriaceae bacterium]